MKGIEAAEYAPRAHGLSAGTLDGDDMVVAAWQGLCQGTRLPDPVARCTGSKF